MLNYIITASRQLMTLGLVLAIVYTFSRQSLGKTAQKILNVGFIVGILLAAMLAIMKNATNFINANYWNLWTYWITVLALILFFIFYKIRGRLGRWQEKLPALFMAAELVIIMFYALPDALAYPFSIYVSETTVFTSSYIVKFGGMLIGVALVFVAALASGATAKRLEKEKVFAAMCAILTLNGLKNLFAAFSIMLAKRMIPSNHILFTLTKYSSNYQDFYIYVEMIVVAVLCVILWMRSFHVNEPYRNSAEHRKIRAKWRNNRRWATTAMICFVLGILSFTVLNNFANQAVELSPTEDPSEIDADYIYIPFDRVSDGHLHRFGYTTESGTELRIIIIRKPNSSSYGIGMDACDICGETGYYERDGQVVCNRCDVVMNINTIGFKGGCNPKIVDYEIEDGIIKVSIPSMMQYEKDFQ